MLKIIKDNMFKLKLKNKHYIAMTMFFFLIVVGGIFLGVHSVKADAITSLGMGVLNFFSSVLLTLAELAMKLTILFIEQFKAIAKYNEFMDAPPVVLGWLMVRDLANMFFVVVLLVIAFGTILGLEQYEWKRSLIKLVFAAIFINFSKLILQLIIDASNVFTVTFLNAISDTAGANVIKMFKLSEMQKMITPQNIGGAALGENNKTEFTSSIFLGSVMAVFMSVTAMATIGVYLVIMVARVVVLWVLMILSPLAFLASALPAGRQYAQEFWSKFTHHVLVAPVMVFFLWLAFATMGNGNIAAQIGVNTSQVQQAGAAFADRAQLPDSPSTTVSEATSWENLSSFIIAIGFLLIGIDFVQKLGVVGGHLTQSAQKFGMAVTTIASGYTVGRWIAGAGKEAASDYGRLVWAATGGKVRHMEGIKEIPLIGAAGKIRRKAAVERLERLEKGREARYKAEGPAGLAAALAPEKRGIVEMEKGTEMIKGKKTKEEERWGAEKTKDIYQGDMKVFSENRTKNIEAELGINLKTDANFAELNNNLQTALQKDDIEGINAAWGNINKEILKVKKDDKDIIPKIRDIDRKSSKGTLMVAGEMEEQYAEEEIGSAESRKKMLKGWFSHEYLRAEREEAKERVSKVNEKMIDERAMKDAATSKLEKEDPAIWQTMNSEQRQKKIEEYLKSLDKTSKENLMKTHVTEETDRRTLEFSVAETLRKAKSSDYWDKLSEQDKKKEIDEYISGLDDRTKRTRINFDRTRAEKEGINAETTQSQIREKANNKISQAERTIAYEKEGVFSGLAKIGGEYDEYKSGRLMKKYASELEGQKALVADVAKEQEGKAGDNYRRWVERKAAEDEQEYNFSYERSTKEISDTYHALEALNQKEESGKELGSEEKKARESLTQKQARLVSSFVRNFTGGFASLVGELDSSFKGVTVNNEENIGRTVAALTTGKKWQDVASDEGFQKTEQDMRKRFKEKEERMFRLMARAMDTAGNNFYASYYRQITEGLDEFGNVKLSFAHNMKDGLGAKGKIGTGTKQKGADWRREQSQMIVEPALNRQRVKDARAFMNLNGEGRSLGVANEASLKAIRSYSSAPEQYISDMSENDARVMFGGSWGRSSWNDVDSRFEMTDDNRVAVGLLMNDFVNRYNTTSSRQEKDKIVNNLRVLFEKIGVSEINGKSIKEMKIGELNEFINEKIISGYEGHKHAFSSDELKKLVLKE